MADMTIESQQETQKHEPLKSKKHEIFLRKQAIWDLMIQGFNQKQIAQEFGVSEKTISRDIHELKKDSIRWMDTLPKGQLQIYHRENVETMEKISRELWNLFDKTEDDSTKLKILVKIADIRKKMSALLKEHKIVELSQTLHEIISPTYDPRVIFDSMPLQRREINYDNV